jgi:hypothetical protein
MECSKHTPTTASTKEFLNTLFISSKGVAGIAKVSVKALDAMARNGDGPRFVMKDGERRYSLAAVGEWMARRNRSPPRERSAPHKQLKPASNRSHSSRETDRRFRSPEAP